MRHPHKSFRLPNSSLNVLERGKRVKVMNACQIDGLLMTIQMEVKAGHNVWEAGTDDAAIKTLSRDMRCASDVESVTEGRARFLLSSEDRIAAYTDNSADFATINLYGNDIDLMTALFAPVMTITYSNVCDNILCETDSQWTSSAPISVVGVK